MIDPSQLLGEGLQEMQVFLKFFKKLLFLLDGLYESIVIHK